MDDNSKFDSEEFNNFASAFMSGLVNSFQETSARIDALHNFELASVKLCEFSAMLSVELAKDPYCISVEKLTQINSILSQSNKLLEDVMKE